MAKLGPRVCGTMISGRGPNGLADGCRATEEVALAVIDPENREQLRGLFVLDSFGDRLLAESPREMHDRLDHPSIAGIVREALSGGRMA